MKIFENDNYLIIDTEQNNLLNPIYAFCKNGGLCVRTNKNEILNDYIPGISTELDFELYQCYMYGERK